MSSAIGEFSDSIIRSWLSRGLIASGSLEDLLWWAKGKQQALENVSPHSNGFKFNSVKNSPETVLSREAMLFDGEGGGRIGRRCQQWDSPSITSLSFVSEDELAFSHVYCTGVALHKPETTLERTACEDRWVIVERIPKVTMRRTKAIPDWWVLHCSSLMIEVDRTNTVSNVWVWAYQCRPLIYPWD